MRICATVAYDGTDFFGWQIQPDKRTVQGEIENALLALFKIPIKITGSGRTDSGVHAQGQIAHFDTASTIPAEKFAFALNTYLPSDVSVLSSEQVDEEFHARYSAKKKTLYQNAQFDLVRVLHYPSYHYQLHVRFRQSTYG